MFEKILKWYKQGLWTEKMVNDALNKGIITQDEFNKILEKEE